MGYTTTFEGKFSFSRVLTLKEARTLVNFADQRHEGHEYPGIWCQWVPSEMGDALVHDGGEKFYEYTEWLSYLIERFFAPWNIELNGTVRFQGEGFGDAGWIVIKHNVVSKKSFVDPLTVDGLVKALEGWEKLFYPIDGMEVIPPDYTYLPAIYQLIDDGKKALSAVRK